MLLIQFYLFFLLTSSLFSAHFDVFGYCMRVRLQIYHIVHIFFCVTEKVIKIRSSRWMSPGHGNTIMIFQKRPIRGIFLGAGFCWSGSFMLMIYVWVLYENRFISNG